MREALADVPMVRPVYRAVRRWLAAARNLLRFPRTSLQMLSESVPGFARGSVKARTWANDRPDAAVHDRSQLDPRNPLARYFAGHTTGAGLHKWIHYLDVYHRYLGRFVGSEAHVLEIGVASGGSLGMWKEYFGDRSRIYGVDIEPGCKIFEDDQIRVLVGDQSSRQFWQDVKREVPRIDVLIDDGAHLPEHMIVTLEELLPEMSPGSVYVCEDIHGKNAFTDYVYALALALNELQFGPADPAPAYCSPLQQAIGAIHFYPFMIVIERASSPAKCFVAPYRGSEWQRFHTERVSVAPLDEQLAAAAALARQDPQPGLDDPR